MKPKLVMKKPSVYEAVQVTSENAGAVANWVGGTVTETTPGRKCVVIPKLHPTANKAFLVRFNDADESVGGDWILRDKRGSYHIVRGDVFTDTYMTVPARPPEDAI